MKVTYNKHINTEKNNRTEFLIINWDYEDGGDYLAEIFCKEFGMVAEEKVDYIYFSIIRLHLGTTTYELLWHEDFGNIIYSIEQDTEIVKMLEQRLENVLEILNEKLQAD